MQTVFLDTNVLVDWLMRRDGFENMKLILRLAEHSYFTLQANTLTMANIAYICGRQLPPPVLYQRFQHFDTLLNVVGVSATAHQSAMAEQWDDYEDALQHFSAMESQADCIVTRNRKDFSQSDLPIFTPEEFLDSLDFEL